MSHLATMRKSAEMGLNLKGILPQKAKRIKTYQG